MSPIQINGFVSDTKDTRQHIAVLRLGGSVPDVERRGDYLHWRGNSRRCIKRSSAASQCLRLWKECSAHPLFGEYLNQRTENCRGKTGVSAAGGDTEPKADTVSQLRQQRMGEKRRAGMKTEKLRVSTGESGNGPADN